MVLDMGQGIVCWHHALLLQGYSMQRRATSKGGFLMWLQQMCAWWLRPDGATSLVLFEQMPLREGLTWRQRASWGNSPGSLQIQLTPGLWEEQEGCVWQVFWASRWSRACSVRSANLRDPSFSSSSCGMFLVFVDVSSCKDKIDAG